ncbi:MAG: hypothetical protein AAGI23_02240 [Bacteroidota bacterium]
MYTFQESDLHFTFQDGYVVKKYDEQPFYQLFSGRGLRAVDFIGLHSDGRAWMMEVKNYSNRPITQAHHIRQKLSGDTSPLFQQMQQKITDTKRAITAIDDYLYGKWWYRWRYQMLSRLGSKNILLQQDRMYWIEVAKRVEEMQCLLWLELPEDWVEERNRLHELAKNMPFELVDRRVIPDFLVEVSD